MTFTAQRTKRNSADSHFNLRRNIILLAAYLIKLHNEEFKDLYTTLSTVMVISGWNV